MKPNANYRMPQYNHLRGEIRRLMIQADLASRIAAPRQKSTDKTPVI